MLDMPDATPEVLLDLSPLLFATALAKVLAGLGYEVDVGGAPDHHALAVISQPGAAAAIPLRILLSPLDSGEGTAEVTDEAGSRLVPVHSLGDLVGLIQGLVSSPRLVTG